MKNQFLTLGAALFLAFGALSLSSCGNGSEASHEHSEHAQYKCPMDCENGKTYEDEGKCPVCKMDLKVAEE